MVNVIQHLQLLTGMHLTKSDSHSAQNSTVSKVFGDLLNLEITFGKTETDISDILFLSRSGWMMTYDDRIWMCGLIFRCFSMFSGFDTLKASVTIRGLKSPDNSQELSAWSPRIS